jgi:hypothetical protein
MKLILTMTGINLEIIRYRRIKMTEQQLSNCCKTFTSVETASEGTNCFVCSECKKACDLFTPVYICPAHLEVSNCFIITWQETQESGEEYRSEKYCGVCFVEMIRQNCCIVEEKLSGGN